jgi:uncharacterized protein YeaO (DUF488 family)
LIQTSLGRAASALGDDVHCPASPAGRTRSLDASWPDRPGTAGGLRGNAVSDSVDIVRVYDDPGRRGDEYRVLVDRLWPRGQSRDAIDRDEWAQDAAPSTELRRWYAHDPARFPEFSRRYRADLALLPGADVVCELRRLSKSRRLVLLTATRDVEHSAAAILRDVIVGGTGS